MREMQRYVINFILLILEIIVVYRAYYSRSIDALKRPNVILRVCSSDIINQGDSLSAK